MADEQKKGVNITTDGSFTVTSTTTKASTWDVNTEFCGGLSISCFVGGKVDALIGGGVTANVGFFAEINASGSFDFSLANCSIHVISEIFELKRMSLVAADTKLNGVVNDLRTLTTDVRGVQNGVGMMLNRVTGLADRVQGAENTAAAAQNTVAASNIVAHATAIRTMATQMQALASDVQTVANGVNLVATRTQVGANDTDLVTLKNTIAAAVITL